jgi:hypothetical protein
LEDDLPDVFKLLLDELACGLFRVELVLLFLLGSFFVKDLDHRVMVFDDLDDALVEVLSVLRDQVCEKLDEVMVFCDFESFLFDHLTSLEEELTLELDDKG